MTRRGALLLLLVVACRPDAGPPQSPARWTVVTDRTGLQAALASAGRRPVLLDITASWCLPCAELQAKTFTDPRVVTALEDHVWIALNVTDGTDEQLALQVFFGATTLPHVLRYGEARPVSDALGSGALAAPPAALDVRAFVDTDEFLAALARR